MFSDLITLDRQLLLLLNGSDSLFLDGLVRTLTAATTWIPLYIALLYLVLKNNDRYQKVLLIVGCAGLCVFLAGSIDDLFIKPAVARWRPTHDPVIGINVDTVNSYRGGRFGFFSAHASNTFSIAIFFVLLVRCKLLTVSLVFWSLVNCWTRLYLGVHFPSDILVGLLWGGVVGTAVWYLYLRLSKPYSPDASYVSTQYTSTGYELRDIHVVVCVLAFTLVCAFIRACFFINV